MMLMEMVLTRGFIPGYNKFGGQHFHKGNGSPTSRPGPTLANIMVWLAILCDPSWKSTYNLVDGLTLPVPVVTARKDMVLSSTAGFGIENFATTDIQSQVNNDYVQYHPRAKFFESTVEWRRHLHSQDEKYPLMGMNVFIKTPFQPAQKDVKGDLEESTGLYKPTMFRPRIKKGLSYLTKYYSQAILNNTSSHNFFGISNSGNSSTDQRFPSVRRKLSFYPPMTSNSLVMSPWSRVGKPAKMRLRWGK